MRFYLVFTPLYMTQSFTRDQLEMSKEEISIIWVLIFSLGNRCSIPSSCTHSQYQTPLTALHACYPLEGDA